MSVLSAIETPAAGAPDARDAAGSNLASRERPLQVVAGPAPSIAAPAADGTAGSTQPRSSSNPKVGGPSRAYCSPRATAAVAPVLGGPIQAGPVQLGRGQAGPVQAGPVQAGPVQAGPVQAGPVQVGPGPAGQVLTGTVMSGSRQRPRLAAGAGVPSTQLRLTRRGRVVVATLVILAVTLAVLLITMLASGGAQATNHGQARAGYQGMHQVVVRPGQTLWSLAAAAEPTADPRNVVQEIMSANALGGPSISAGQLLWVP
jgi:hypothetical protein